MFRDDPNYWSASFPAARAFQEVAHRALRDGLRNGHKKQVLMAPTGAGKTYLGLRIAHEALMRGKRAVFVCDRTTLIDQTSETADSYGLAAHGVIQAQHYRYEPTMPFQIASAQTLARRMWPAADVIIVDECHTQLKAWTDHIRDDAQRDVAVIGLSATPFSKGLGRLFSNLVNAATMDQLTREGVLVPMRVFSCTTADMTGAETAGGEWTDKAAEERELKIVGDVVAEWCKFGENRKTIVFGSTIAHCEELCKQFNDAGIHAEMFTSHTPDGARKAIKDEFKKPDSAIRILISVEALAKGFDVKDVGCVVDCRPLRKSLSTAIQMWGRGLRASPETGKADCLLLDHSGNIMRFAEDYTDIFYNGLNALDAGEKLDKAIRKEPEDKPKGCPKCSAIPFIKKCMQCGFEVRSTALIEAVPGSMREITLGKTNKRIAVDAVWRQACAYARAHSAPDKQAGRAAHIYRDMTGTWPPRSWGFESTPNEPISREVLNFIKHKNIAFAKAREAARG